MKFTDLFIRRPVLSIALSLLLLALGIKSTSLLTLRQYPEVQYPSLTVSTAYPGASAELVQGFITTPIQKEIASVKGLDYMTSESKDGLSVISVYLQAGSDANTALVETTAKVNRVRGKLPQGVEAPLVDRMVEGGISSLQFIAFYSNQLNPSQLTDYLDRVVVPVLATLPGVGAADIVGRRDFAMRLWLDRNRMAASGVSAGDIRRALADNNVQAAAGNVESAYVKISIDPKTSLETAEQFRRIVVKQRAEGRVYLEDVARVEMGAETYDQHVHFEGKNSAMISIEASTDANPVDVAKRVRDAMKSVEAQLPPSVGARIVFDASDNINESINEVTKTLLEASAIVMVIIFLFLGSLRSVLVPMVTIPLSLVGVTAAMLLMGFSVNLLTLLAMVLAIGLVVDDAIVVLENIQRHIDEGETPMNAALMGAREIAFPVVAMTLTLAAVYLPVGFVGGLTGTLFTEFAFTLAGAVVVSGIVALTLSPMMCSRLLRKEKHSGMMARTERNLAWVAEQYRRILTMALDSRPSVLIFSVMVLISIVILYRSIPQEMAPLEDDGAIYLYGFAPLSSSAEFMQAYTQQVADISEAVPEKKENFVGSGLFSPNSFFSMVLLKPHEQRDRSALEVQEELTKSLATVAGFRIFAYNAPALPGISGDLPLKFVLSTTSSYAVLEQIAEKIQEDAQKSGQFFYVDSGLRHEKPTVAVDIDREKAAELGVSVAEIGDTLGLMLAEDEIGRFAIEGRSYKIITQVEKTQRLTPDMLGQYYVKNNAGVMVPLSAVVSLRDTIEPNARTQFQQLNSTTISAMPATGVSLGDAINFFELAAARHSPEGFRHDYVGESRQFLQEGSKLLLTFLFSFVMIYLVLAMQFESFTDPITVLVSVPLSICGALIPLALGLGTLNLYTQIGLVTLIGLISKHGILIVDFANNARASGLNVRDAIVDAATTRLRPILMTTFARVFGVVPLLLASGAGANSRFAIGLVITAGMSVGTLFTLLVVPVMYTVFAREDDKKFKPAEFVPGSATT